MSIRIRGATVNDADKIISLYEEFTQYLRALGDTTEARFTAAALMTQTQAIAREHGASEILWSVYKLNPEARVFYEKLGGRHIDDLHYMYLQVGDPE